MALERASSEDVPRHPISGRVSGFGSLDGGRTWSPPATYQSDETDSVTNHSSGPGRAQQFKDEALKIPDQHEHMRSRWEPQTNAALRSLQVPITAGRRDPISPLQQTEALARYFIEQGATVDLRLHDGGHEVRQEEMAAIASFLTSKD